MLIWDTYKCCRDLHVNPPPHAKISIDNPVYEIHHLPKQYSQSENDVLLLKLRLISMASQPIKVVVVDVVVVVVVVVAVVVV